MSFKSVKWASLPKNFENSILELYHASTNELGCDRTTRNRQFNKLVKTYYPWVNSMELSKIHSLIDGMEQIRYAKLTAEKLNDQYSKQVLKLFGSVDEDNNGSVSLEEFESFFTSHYKGDAKKYFENADTNGDGQLDCNEFFTLVSKTPQLLLHFDKIVKTAQRQSDCNRVERNSAIFHSEYANATNNDANVKPRRPSLSDVRHVYTEDISEYVNSSKYLAEC